MSLVYKLVLFREVELEVNTFLVLYLKLFLLIPGSTCIPAPSSTSASSSASATTSAAELFLLVFFERIKGEKSVSYDLVPNVRTGCGRLDLMLYGDVSLQFSFSPKCYVTFLLALFVGAIEMSPSEMRL